MLFSGKGRRQAAPSPLHLQAGQLLLLVLPLAAVVVVVVQGAGQVWEGPPPWPHPLRNKRGPPPGGLLVEAITGFV